jgi:indole-3-acetate monooxygenase
MSPPTPASPITAAEITARVDALLPEIAERATETETARQVPADLVAKLRHAGCFRTGVPARFGGADWPLRDRLRMIEQVAAADGAVGWIVAIGSQAPNFLGYLPLASFARIYAQSPDVIVAGGNGPTGVAEPVDGGFRVTGQWAWASGCHTADWLYGACIVSKDGEPISATPTGPQDVRNTFFRPCDVTFHDTWHVVGMKGSGSCDISVRDLFVPTEMTANIRTEMPVGPDAAFLHSFSGLGGLILAAVGLGIAAGALQDVIALAKGGKQRLRSVLRSAEQPVFQYRLGAAEVQILAARDLLLAQADRIEAAAPSMPRGAALLIDPVAKQTSAAAMYAVQVLSSAIDTLYAIAGGTSVYERTPLQRRFRDMHALAQHMAYGDPIMTRYGAGLVGIEAGL